GHRAHPHLDLRPHAVRAGRLEHGRPLDARHGALEVEHRRPALLERLGRGEGVVEDDCHARGSSVGGRPALGGDPAIRGVPYAPRVGLAAGVYELGPDSGTLWIRTGRTGAVAKAGHDLLLHVTQWSARLEIGADPAASTVALDADPRSLRVVEGTGGEVPPRGDRRGGPVPTHHHGGPERPGGALPTDPRPAP